MLRGRWNRRVGLRLTLPVLALALVSALALRPTASASEDASGVFTAVTTDGSLRAIDGRSWLMPGDDSWRPHGDLFQVSVDHGVSAGPKLDGAAVTAFGWASPAVVGAARAGAVRAPVQETLKTPTADFPHEVKVYFSKRPASDDDFMAVYPVTRMVGDAGVAHGALEELLRGPTPEEQAEGYFSELGAMVVGPSDCDEESFTLRIGQGTATLRFCRIVTSAGIGQDARTFSQLRATLLQFPTIQRFRLLTRDGDCLFDESGENRCLTNPLR